MKIYYLQSEHKVDQHKIIVVNYDKDDFMWENTTQAPYGIMSIDEIVQNNKAICIDLVQTQFKLDKVGENKYHIELESGDPVLYKKDGWEEFLGELEYA